MTTVVCIVDGDGGVSALPVLLRRLGEKYAPGQWVNVPPPIRVRRDRFLNRPEEFRRQWLLASSKCAGTGWVLVWLDADDDCPAVLGACSLEDSQKVVGPHQAVSVVLANREYESWFVAAASSLSGCRGFVHDGQDEPDPDRPRDAKGWIKRRMAGRGDSEITDQPAMSALFDLDLAFERSRSFRKLCQEWRRQMPPP